MCHGQPQFTGESANGANRPEGNSCIIQPMANTYLDVPYKAKDEAKALGARWDPAARQWYVPEGRDLVPFHAWLPAGKMAASSVSEITTDIAPVTHMALPDVAVAKKGVPLSQLLAGVAQAVAHAFKSGVWTIVEVVEARTKNGHIYLELSERTSDGAVLATARATIWANTANKILPEFERTTGASIAPGIKLLVRAKPTFKALYGFGLEIDAIDPEYTLGDLEARKREIRTRLTQEGIYTSNKKLPFPWDFNVVLVVAPQGAAGLGDFQAEAVRLERLGICRFVYIYSRFQGEGAAREICLSLQKALTQWAEAEGQPDAVAVIRGGGAVTDLAWLNDYELAKTLCTLDIPVFTGIGHERDSTVLDEVANTRFDTPSKVIAGIEQTIRGRVAESQANFEFLVGHIRHHLQVTKGQLERSALRVQAGAVRQVATAKETTSALINGLCLDATNTVHDAKQGTRTLQTEIRHDAHQLLSEARRDSFTLCAEIRAEAGNVVGTARAVTTAKLEAVRDRAAVDIRRSREVIRLELRDVMTSARRVTVDARTASIALFREVAGQGPEKTLRRGFAIARDGKGKPVTSVAGAASGTDLEIEFRDGRVAAHVK